MWPENWNQYKGRIIGIVCGVFFGMIYLVKGFWDMLIVAFILFVCYFFGKKADEKQQWIQIAEIWQRLMDRWRMFR